MKVHYTGRHETLSAVQRRRLEGRLSKLARILDRKEEKEAHVVVTAERHLHRAEITVNYFDRALAGIESAPEVFAAMAGAVDKLEKQVLKLSNKRRDTRRGARGQPKSGPPEKAPPAEASPPQVFRVNHTGAAKPMTVDEALLEMSKDRQYMVYRDAETDRLRVLLRRRDGHFDLIES